MGTMQWIYSEWLTPPDRRSDKASPFYPWREDVRVEPAYGAATEQRRPLDLSEVGSTPPLPLFSVGPPEGYSRGVGLGRFGVHMVGISWRNKYHVPAGAGAGVAASEWHSSRATTGTVAAPAA